MPSCDSQIRWFDSFFLLGWIQMWLVWCIHHSYLWCDKCSNNRQSIGETQPSCRHFRNWRDSSISWQSQMACSHKQSLQTQVKNEVNRILRKTILNIFSPVYNNQPGAITRDHRNQTLVSYEVALQRKTEHGPKFQNVTTIRQSKRPFVVLYNAHNVF